MLNLAEIVDRSPLEDCMVSYQSPQIILLSPYPSAADARPHHCRNNVLTFVLTQINPFQSKLQSFVPPTVLVLPQGSWWKLVSAPL